MKILLLSLPVPGFYYPYQKGNHQLFAVYAKLIASRHPEKDISIITLSRDITDRANDEAIFNAIISEKPDIVGFSLYVWNTIRSQNIAMMLKKSGITTAAGGPEVNQANDNELKEKFDILHEGDGECWIENIINHREIQSKNPAETLLNPLLEGYENFISDMTEDGVAYIELERGCPYHCSFCAYGKKNRSIDELDLNRFKEIAQKCYHSKVETLYLLAPTLNRSHKRFSEMLTILSRLRKESGHTIHLFGELKAELLTDEEIALCSQAGFCTIEFGVQHLGDISLVEKAAHISKRLSRAGITSIIDFIIGLPGECYEDGVITIDACEKAEILEYCNFYHLQVLPDTPLRKECIEKGYSFMDNPPYLIQSTDAITMNDIKRLYYYLETEYDYSYRDTFDHGDIHSFYTPKDIIELNQLQSITWYQSGCFLNSMIFDSNEIIKAYTLFIDRHPEIFHTLYLYIGKTCTSELITQLRTIFTQYSTYYDYYCSGSGFYENDSFAKVLRVFANPEIDNKELKKLMSLADVDFFVFDTDNLTKPAQKNIEKRCRTFEISCYTLNNGLPVIWYEATGVVMEQKKDK